jgi:hypothetical protein
VLLATSEARHRRPLPGGVHAQALQGRSPPACSSGTSSLS